MSKPMFYLFILFKDKGLLNRRVLQNKQFFRLQILAQISRLFINVFKLNLKKRKFHLKSIESVLLK